MIALIFIIDCWYAVGYVSFLNCMQLKRLNEQSQASGNPKNPKELFFSF